MLKCFFEHEFSLNGNIRMKNFWQRLSVRSLKRSAVVIFFRSVFLHVHSTSCDLYRTFPIFSMNIVEMMFDRISLVERRREKKKWKKMECSTNCLQEKYLAYVSSFFPITTDKHFQIIMFAATTRQIQTTRETQAWLEREKERKRERERRERRRAH